jgi:hypothetical protein
MPEWEVVDDGSFNGLRKLIRATDADEGTVEIKYEDVGSTRAAVEANKGSEGFKRRGDIWHVGHVPASLGLKWLAEEGIDMWNPKHQDAVLKKLACSDYRHLVPGLNRIIF